ncbi:hypothetical protein CFF8240_0987 [Campylobacter fetus subsp. fetus 82-40]|uniref:Uncharacterized protein n=1 Tax=Campylobacter fetus subsp. fetus (strain 82-40) TaxID=360106 RepID=A0RPM2_CAMFF|nr:hypothetical protein CFF8240_0987 [Campylobacter fetus subsp. fetus 82-40]
MYGLLCFFLIVNDIKFNIKIFEYEIVFSLAWLFLSFFINFLLYIFIRYLSKKSTRDNLKFIKIYPVYSEYVASYFAVCVVTFSMSFLTHTNSIVETSLIGKIIIVLFLFYIFHINNIGYLNPFLYLIGKRVYKVESENSNFIIIADKINELKNTMKIDSLIKIDENTFYKIKEN